VFKAEQTAQKCVGLKPASLFPFTRTTCSSNYTFVCISRHTAVGLITCHVLTPFTRCIAVYFCSQESRSADTLGMLHALGAAGQADGRIMLHSVLAGGKRRITAELAHTAQEDGQPLLQLQRVGLELSQLVAAPVARSSMHNG
jgi:hypothetical protein